MSRNLSESLDRINTLIETRCTDAAGDIHINPAHLGVFKEETDYLGERLGLSPFQCVLLAVIIQIPENRCNYRKIGSGLGMSYLKILSFSMDFKRLRDDGYIRILPDNDIRVTPAAVKALTEDKPLEKLPVEGLSAKAIFRRMRDMMRMVALEQMSEDRVREETDMLIKANRETAFAAACLNRLSAPEIDRNERYLFYVLTYLFLDKGYRSFEADDIDPYFEDTHACLEIKGRFEDGTLGLLNNGILEPTCQDGMVTQGSCSFKAEAEREFFSEFKKSINPCSVKLMDTASLPAKELFYNAKEGTQVERLASLLDPEQLNRIYEAMTARGLRTGFACLFYGSPGTGKTETVYQLARRTGRKILQADVAQLRNCYVGETEKNVRQLFRDYTIANNENERTPILLFNEADAILGKRMEGAARAIDRMENSVQNILLQELEDFSGILIATTNLTGNLDPAFERRFLYKILFEKPEVEPRAKIWKTQLPALSDEEARKIAAEFDFSGGQIENVVRKNTIDGILSGRETDFEQLRQYCLEESVCKSSRNKIGF